eukprot:Opistho-2@15511
MDKFQSQLEYFISKSPDFFKDGSISEIDTKHQKIISSAYELLHSGFTIDSLRNWAGQSDMGVNHGLNIFSKAAIGVRDNSSFLARILGNIANRINFRIQGLFSHSMMLDDISIVESIGGKDLLTDNPQIDTPGASQFPLVNGYSVSHRWLRYIYLLAQIRNQQLLAPGDVWVDIGSFYGGLQGLVKKYYPTSRIVLVDFHHQLLRSYLYLSTQYPNSNHYLPSEVDQFKNLSDMPEGSFLYVPVNDFHKIAGHKAALMSNFFSLGEMRKDHFSNYFDSPLFQTSKHIYLVNRFVSSPFFEKTYDTDITIRDYMIHGKPTRHFDIFPINHYQIVRRELYGRNFFRNTSSSYFEIIY